MRRRDASDDLTLRDLDVPRRRSAMPLMSEPMVPWLGGAFVIALVNLAVVVSGHQLPIEEQAIVLLGLCAVLATGAMVAARSNRVIEANDREERARPAVDELAGTNEPRSASYVVGMAHWTNAMLELIDHAAADAEPGSVAHRELLSAAADTRELRDLLATSAGEPLSINDTAMLHGVCTLWETSQPRIEHLAAEVDRTWHQRWAARAVADRRLRHGTTAPRPMVLPYRA